jgi:phospholipase/carboxylesterase
MDSKADLPLLDGPMLAPADGVKPGRLVILLHGVGADGHDLIGLAPYFQIVLPDALFVSPNAPYPFDMAPFGYQWFSLKDMSPPARLAGCQRAAPILDRFIDDKLAESGLSEADAALVGFSQGAMMALYVGLRRRRPLAGIVGYSGMLVGRELLADAIRSRPPVLLVHGDADQVVPVAALDDAVEGLTAVGVDVRHARRPGLPHGIDDEGIRLGMQFLAERFGVDIAAVKREHDAGG